ncbi:MAG: type 1 glutamine amidotransferase [Flavipsychrobacter sp.]|jgi:protease I|nr:type 1 glutamine amidotransferase [Flavipsychrobacter sp.]
MKKAIRNTRTGDDIKAMQADVLAEPVLVKENLLKKKYRGKKAAAPKEKTDTIADEAIINVAILSEDGFEEIELLSPKHALEAAGAHVDVICPHDGKIKGWNKTHWGKDVAVDKTLSEARADHYDAVILPGGVMNPDKLRQNKDAIMFLKHFINCGKPVAAICHGAQTLIETGMLEGKTMTSYPSLQTDLKNAGVNWVDKEVVHYGQFITSRKPADLGAFNKELIYTLLLYEH